MLWVFSVLIQGLRTQPSKRGECPGRLDFAPRDGRVGRLITGIVTFGNWSIDRLLGEVRGVWTVVY